MNGPFLTDEEVFNALPLNKENKEKLYKALMEEREQKIVFNEKIDVESLPPLEDLNPCTNFETKFELEQDQNEVEVPLQTHQ